MPIPPVNLVVGGDDNFFVSRRIRDLKRDAIDTMPDADVNDLDASTATLADFQQESGATLLASRSITIVRNIQNADQRLAAGILEFARETAASGGENGILICHHDGSAKGQQLVRNLVQAHASRSTVPDLKKPQARVTFVTDRFRQLGRHIDIRAAQQLASILGEKPEELYAMCGQLCEDWDDDPMTLDRVNATMAADPRVSGFQVSDAAMAGNTIGAVLAMRAAVEQGVAPQAIIGALASNMRTMAKAAAITTGTMTEQESGVPRWMLDRARGNLKGWTARGMCRTFEMLAWADEQSKTNGGDDVYALEKAVECVASKGRM